MKPWKRNVLIAFLISTATVIILSVVWLFHPEGDSLLTFMRGSIPLKLLFALAALIAFLGVAYGVYIIVDSLIHSRESLYTGEEGNITISTSALVSTARRALDKIENITVQDVKANVLQRKGEAAITMKVKVIPRGIESLMATASQIQKTCKQSIEAFTEHEVLYVSVDYIEPKKRSDIDATDKIIKSRVDGNNDSRESESFKTKSQASGAVASSESSTFADDTVSRESGSNKSTYHEEESKPSLWQRIKSKFSFNDDEKDEDIFNTEAEVTTLTNEDSALDDSVKQDSQATEERDIDTDNEPEWLKKDEPGIASESDNKDESQK